MVWYKNSCKSFFSFSYYGLRPLTYICSKLVPEIKKSTQIRDAIPTQDRPTVQFKNILTNTHAYSGIVTVTPTPTVVCIYRLSEENMCPFRQQDIGLTEVTTALQDNLLPVNTFNSMIHGVFHRWDFSSAQCGTLLAHVHRNSSLTLHFCVENYLHGSITDMFSDVFTRQ